MAKLKHLGATVTYVCSLFNDAYSIAQTVYRRMKG
jgi:hypothetical protein